LAADFDRYWNSKYAYPVGDVVSPQRDRADPGQTFDELAAADASLRATTKDAFGADPLGAQITSGRVRLLVVHGTTFADDPKKADPGALIHDSDTLTHRFFNVLAEAKDQALLISPYFVPNKAALERIRQLRASGVQVRVITNTLASSDEPLVSVGLGRYKVQMLEMGVELFELSSTVVQTNEILADGLLGSTFGRLHAKVGAVDRKVLLIGSLNLDPRSASINTEVGVAVRSRELAEMILEALNLEDLPGTYRVRLKPNSRSIVWTAVNSHTSTSELPRDPNTTWWQRLQLFLLFKLVPESQL